MLDELRDLAQKKRGNDNEFRSKKEQEKIRKGVQSGRLKEFFEPVTEAIEKTEKQVGQLVPIPNIAGLPAPLAGPVGPLAIEGPEEPEREEEV